MFVLITGTLHRDPIARPGKTGAAFVTANLRYRAGNEAAWASVIAFAEDARTELLRLHEARNNCGTCPGLAATKAAEDGSTRRTDLPVKEPALMSEPNFEPKIWTRKMYHIGTCASLSMLTGWRE